MPAAPSPVGAPGTPFAFKATLNPDGSLGLSWECANPAGAAGTMYQVARRDAADAAAGGFVSLANCGKRAFLDATVPAGAAQVTYKVTACRSTATGTAAEFLVNLGTSAGGGGGGGGGAAVATVVSAPKLAA